MKSTGKKRVALALPLGLPFIERILGGVLVFARQERNWSFTQIPEHLAPSFDWLKQWDGDGALVMITSKNDARFASKLPIPVVNLAAYLENSFIPTVMVDHREIGRMAARHLLEQRFRRFGYYGVRGLLYSSQRRDGFLETIKHADGICSTLEVFSEESTSNKWRRQQKELDSWLKQMRPPVGIMACTDLRAGFISNACRRLGLRIPEDVALIGVDNDPVSCEFHEPPLSSVSRNDHSVGLRAAELLDDLMTGHRPPLKPILVLPDGVVRRRSTETMAIDDQEVDTVVRYMREHISEKFGMERIIEVSGLSRRMLEYRFKSSIGTSPYVLLNQLRVERAKQLLAEKRKRTLSEISKTCGFSELRRFRLVFRRITGKSPAKL